MKKRLLAMLLIVAALLTACGYIVVEDPETLTIGSLLMPSACAEGGEGDTGNSYTSSDESLISVEEDAMAAPLMRGSKGENVKALQTKLREYGFLKGKADGIFGANTEKAVKQAQNYKNALDEAEEKKLKEEIRVRIERARTKQLEKLSALTIGGTQDSGNALSKDVFRFTGITTNMEKLPEKEVFSADGIVKSDFAEYLMNGFRVYAGDLKSGSRGMDVTRLQTRLNSMNYLLGGIDGQYGANTQSAVKYFQRLNGLKETGIADLETQSVLFSEKCKLSDYPMYRYKVEISISKQRVYVYEWNYGAYSKLVKTMKCTTGAYETPTPLGDFKMGGPCGRWYYFKKYDCWAQYAYRIVGGILFHSVLYSEKDEATLRQGSVDALGSRASHGCVRLTVADAKWLYNHIPAGTTCTIYN